MNPADIVATCFSRTFDFKGRSSRAEFWWFALAVSVLTLFVRISLVLSGISPTSLTGALALEFVQVILFVPTLSVAVRRLHDVGKSGWWLLIALTIIGYIWLIIWWVRPGAVAPNRFGRNPLHTDAEAEAS